jgi:hypothetical protein
MMTGLVVPVQEEYFLKKYKLFYKNGKELTWNLNSYEITILKTGHLAVLGVDQNYQPIILIDLENLPKILEPALLTLIPKILALIRMKMHLPKIVETSKIILNIEGKNLISSGNLVKNLMITLDRYQHQYTELLVLNSSWTMTQIFAVVKKLGIINANTEHKMKFLKTKQEISQSFGRLLDAKFVPKKFGGERQRGLTWPPDFTEFNYEPTTDGGYQKLVEPVGVSELCDRKICPFYFQIDEDYHKKFFDFSNKRALKKTYPSFNYSELSSQNQVQSVHKRSRLSSKCFNMDFDVSEVDSIDNPVYFSANPTGDKQLSTQSLSIFYQATGSLPQIGLKDHEFSQNDCKAILQEVLQVSEESVKK